MPSGRQIAKINYEIFESWIMSRSNDELKLIIHRGRLNRREIAISCGFCRSAIDQNSAIRKKLLEVEDLLRKDKILPEKVKSWQTPRRHKSAHIVETEDQRIRKLETDNALLRAENSELKNKLSSFAIIAEVLAETGRMSR